VGVFEHGLGTGAATAFSTEDGLLSKQVFR
jgi:hypothetical protein